MEDEEIQEVKKICKKMNQFAVIGLGRFGRSVAIELTQLGKSVLAIDNNPDNVKQVEGLVLDAVVTDSTSKDVLRNLGVQNFDCAIVSIGSDMQSNILTTLICKELGVGYVVARACDEQNKKILECIGTDMVVFPESYTGRKIANLLANPSKNEILNLSDDFKIVEIPLPDNWQDKTIIDIDIRKKYKISVILIKRDKEVISVEPETQLLKGDYLIVAGDDKSLDSLSNMTSEVIDIEKALKSAF